MKHTDALSNATMIGSRQMKLLNLQPEAFLLQAHHFRPRGEQSTEHWRHCSKTKNAEYCTVGTEKQLKRFFLINQLDLINYMSYCNSNVRGKASNDASPLSHDSELKALMFGIKSIFHSLTFYRPNQ